MQTVLAVAALVLGATLYAQETRVDSVRLDSRLVAGARVRVGLAAPTPAFEARLLAASRDTIEIEEAGLIRAFGLRDLATLEVRQVDRSLAVALGTVGFVTGSVVYLRWCAQDPRACHCDEERERESEGDEHTSMFEAMAFGSAFLGALIGHALTAPHWEAVTLPLRVGVAPVRGGFGVYARVSLR